MGSLRACFVVAISALAAACGDDGGTAKIDAGQSDAPMPDAKIFLDAPPPMFDFTCTGNTTAPTTATTTITLSGTVQAADYNGQFSIAAVNGATLDACVAGAANCMNANTDGTDMSDAQGAWSIGPFAGVTAQDDFIKMTATGQGLRPTYVYPASPFVADQANIPVLTFGAGALTALGFANCDTSKGLIGLAVTDCTGSPVTDSANVTITVKQGGTAVANVTVVPLGDFVAQAAGTFLICGVPANASTEVSAKYMTTNFLPHNVMTAIGATTATLVVPGY